MKSRHTSRPSGEERLQIVNIQQTRIGEGLEAERMSRAADGKRAIGKLLEAKKSGQVPHLLPWYRER